MTKIILRKTTSAIFLAIVLIVGTFAVISPSFMIGAHAQQYGMDQMYNNYKPDYGMNSYDKKPYGKEDNNYYKSKDSSNVKCNNINVNLNGYSGNEIGASEALGALATQAQAEDEGEVGASILGNGGGNDGGRPSGSDTYSRYVCINNNNNDVVEAEEPTTTTLKVTKQITCEDEIEGDCEDLLELVNENDYIIQVEGNNPDPSSPFPGSPPPTGTDVTLGPGDYVVSETFSDSIFDDQQTFFATHPSRVIGLLPPSFTGACTESVSLATGTIAVGESQTCNIINPIAIFATTSNP